MVDSKCYDEVGENGFVVFTWNCQWKPLLFQYIYIRQEEYDRFSSIVYYRSLVRTESIILVFIVINGRSKCTFHTGSSPIWLQSGAHFPLEDKWEGTSVHPTQVQVLYLAPIGSPFPLNEITWFPLSGLVLFTLHRTMTCMSYILFFTIHMTITCTFITAKIATWKQYTLTPHYFNDGIMG